MYLLFRQNDCLYFTCVILRRITILHKSNVFWVAIAQFCHFSTQETAPFAFYDWVRLRQPSNGFINSRNGFINSHLEQYIVPGRTCPSSFSEFRAVTEKDVLGLVTRSKIKACSLDPSPATIMKEYYCELVPVFKTIINLSL